MAPWLHVAPKRTCCLHVWFWWPVWPSWAPGSVWPVWPPCSGTWWAPGSLCPTGSCVHLRSSESFFFTHIFVSELPIGAATIIRANQWNVYEIHSSLIAIVIFIYLFVSIFSPTKLPHMLDYIIISETHFPNQDATYCELGIIMKKVYNEIWIHNSVH